MILKQGLKVTIGNKSWTGEIQDDVFAAVTKDWSQSKVDDFRKRHEEPKVTIELQETE